MGSDVSTYKPTITSLSPETIFHVYKNELIYQAEENGN